MTGSTSSILNTIKPMIGVEVSDNSFDSVIVVHINAVLTSLTQMGVGPKNGYSITGSGQTWGDFLGSDPNAAWLNNVQSYVALKTRMLFDPPLQNAVATATNDLLKELEFRISVSADPGWHKLD